MIGSVRAGQEKSWHGSREKQEDAIVRFLRYAGTDTLIAHRRGADVFITATLLAPVNVCAKQDQVGGKHNAKERHLRQ
jgi:hypothetical protein